MIDQIAIGALGVTTVLLTNDHRESVRVWACVFGLIAQPFWFYATISASQWGITLLTCFYTLGWSRGFYNFWIKDDQWKSRAPQFLLARLAR